MSGHTPGPWRAEEFDVLHCAGPVRERTIAFGALFRSESAEEVRANARLIAAAPELLACVKAILLMYESMVEFSHVESRVRELAEAAIAKAEGAA